MPERLSPDGPAYDLLPAVDEAAHGGRTVVVFPLLHGPLGEDGTVQGLLELAGVPYVGAGVLSSALAMDKAKAKEVLAFNGIPQVRSRAIHESDFVEGMVAELVEAFGLPAFVKPANLGSSVGVSKAKTEAELRSAIDLAFSYDEWIVVEEAIVGARSNVRCWATCSHARRCRARSGRRPSSTTTTRSTSTTRPICRYPRH